MVQRAKGLDAEYLFSAITANWERKQPVWVMLMVSTLNADEIASRGIPVLDLYLLMQAEKQKKRVHAIERPDEHCNPLNELSLDMVSCMPIQLIATSMEQCLLVLVKSCVPTLKYILVLFLFSR